jgi:uncharacterized membrane protein YgdD (TMEM256/DUF423 family)
MIPKIVYLFACFYGATAVILGAIGAHWLKSKVEIMKIDLSQIESFKTGVLYQFLHAIVLLVLAFQADKLAGNLYNSAVILFIIGICFFSGSIYLLSTKDLLGLTNYRWIGPITPIGGIFLITGWFLLAFLYKKIS